MSSSKRKMWTLYLMGIMFHTAYGQERIAIDVHRHYQTVESFMASDAWMPNIVGTYWDKNIKSDIAKLLFSKEIKKGQAQGIGLSGWRFLLGGGSYNQGSHSDIPQMDRRSESFMDPITGEIDWSKQAGQQYFLKKAKKYGVDQFVLFSISPPAYLTKNGKAYSSAGAYANLKNEHYNDFAEYIASCILHFKTKHQINFNFISPLNEPQYDWEKPAQEGSGWQNKESYKIIKEIDNALLRNKLKTKILFGEAVSYKYLTQSHDKPNRGDIIQDFFTAKGKYSLLNLSSLAHIASAHSYWLDGDWKTLQHARDTAWHAAQKAGIKLYQTEWSMLGDHYAPKEFIGFEKASEMDIAIYMSKVIYADLVHANVSSWSYWTSLDIDRWNHKNRFLLIELLPVEEKNGDLRSGGTYQTTKSLWTLGNYSLFIRPGYRRIHFEHPKNGEQLFGTGFISPDKKTFVAVLTNNSSDTQHVIIDPKMGIIRSRHAFITDASRNLEEQKLPETDHTITIPSKSVTTIRYCY